MNEVEIFTEYHHSEARVVFALSTHLRMLVGKDGVNISKSNLG